MSNDTTTLSYQDSLLRSVYANLQGGCAYVSHHEQSTQKVQDMRMVVAISGGCDSTGMLGVLCRIKKMFPSIEIYAGYVNHAMQDKVLQEQERASVESICAQLDVPLLETSHTHRTTCTNEKEAREFRYRVLIHTSRLHKVPFLVTAHHREDQYETVLMRMLEGRGVSGLGGIPPIRVIEKYSSFPSYIIRPGLSMKHLGIQWDKVLLQSPPVHDYAEQMRDISKNELLSEVETQALPVHRDKSNQENIHTRNKVRNIISPSIQKVFDNASEKVGNLSLSLRQLLLDIQIPSQSLWQQYGGNTQEIRVPQNMFSQLSYSQQRTFLLEGINMLGIKNVTNAFLNSILVHTGISLNRSFFIDDIALHVGERYVEIQHIYPELRIEEPCLITSNTPKKRDITIEGGDDPFKIRILPHTDAQNDIIRGICYEIAVCGSLCLAFPTKHDTIMQGTHSINIRALLSKQRHTARGWKQIPLLKDDNGVVLVAGETQSVRSYIRHSYPHNAHTTESHPTHYQVYLSYHEIVVLF